MTTKGRFAVTAVIDLALHQGQGPVTLTGINQHQKISLSYLEQLFGKLHRHEIVESVHSPGGGYSLAHHADDMIVASIIIAVDELLDTTRCGGKGNCGGEKHIGGHTGRCMMYDPWATLNQKMVEYLDSVSLQNLVDQQHKRQPEMIQDAREACLAYRERTPACARAAGTPATTSVATEPIRQAPLVNSVFNLA